MKNLKLSSFIFVLLAIFLLADFIGYRYLYNNIKCNYEKDTKILFYELQNRTAMLLVKLFYDFEKQKETLLAKHREVADYLSTHDLNGSLSGIYRQINTGHADRPYDIYLSGKDLIIYNTTYAHDLGFDLSFAKPLFDAHHAKGVTGISTPIREDNGNDFLSYTDQYIARDGDPKAALLQVSYSYRDLANEIASIEKIIKETPSIRSANAFCFGSDDFVYEFLFLDPEYNRSVEELLKIKKKAHSLLKRFNNGQLATQTYTREGIHYKNLFLATDIPFDDQLKVVYSIQFDESALYEKLSWLNTAMLLLTLLGLLAIFFIAKMRGKEIRLLEQDRFVQSAMHEIKTPLSVITLNNELRQIEYGKDPYSEEIDSALKVLRNAYNSMSYIVTKEVLSYETRKLSLAKVLQERIDFFETIARSNDKSICAHIESDCTVEIAPTELERLIDNNLSNAIKYSAPGTQITVELMHDTLSFRTEGETIRDKEQIFERYVRENTTVGGYGLGLSIIREIAQKYAIGISLESTDETGTIFTYFFKCHTDDIPSG